ncbi:hypothetical protein [Psychroflexus sp. ALD_RP9]|uniref:hypothetical protein n=1 Tax=Psychroflexus sp. ALD_RP9 TaxID=2777186 RepID=UPI001A8CFCFD|nr:hypothetical protein [Psychroflexus sp. ALD_RP9]QSS96216.1 hypothetical protein IMZ30_07045 [Psychroflexus sp. ALD_RP9]
MKRLCEECQEPVSGRSDKRFCSDYCRNAFNNKRNRDQTKVVRNTNNQLRKNYRILNELNPNDKTKVNRQTLMAKGFNFKLFTSIYKTKKGSIYYFVYNQGYLDIGNDYFALVKRD